MNLWERIMREAQRCDECSSLGSSWTAPRGRAAVRIGGLGKFCSYDCARNAYAKRCVGCRTCGYVHPREQAHLGTVISMNVKTLTVPALQRIAKAAARVPVSRRRAS